jgi:hypothetical protein
VNHQLSPIDTEMMRVHQMRLDAATAQQSSEIRDHPKVFYKSRSGHECAPAAVVQLYQLAIDLHPYSLSTPAQNM